MGHVAIGHQKTVGPDDGFAGRRRSSVDRHAFPHRGAGAQARPGFFPFKFEVLGFRADEGMGVQAALLAHGGAVVGAAEGEVVARLLPRGREPERVCVSLVPERYSR